VDPATHALTSLALARAGQRHLPRFGTCIILTAGLAPDLDYASYFGGPSAFLRFHRSMLHCALGAAVVACGSAAVFWWIARVRDQKRVSGSPQRIRFAPMLLAGAIGAAAHVVLDIASGTGAQLLWPFDVHRYAWNIIANLDPWMIILLAIGLFVPPLLGMVGEEIGERKKQPRGRTAAIAVLAIFAAYLGMRATLHSRAIDLLLGQEYHGQSPLSAGAFPSKTSLFTWRGVVATDNTVEQANVSVSPETQFDAERSLTHYKPEDSPALGVGERARTTETFLKYARFPLASVARIEDGYRFELRDMQFASGDIGPENIFVRVDLDSGLRITRQRFLFAASPNP
jgi:membrane-bound metal-dependent hydrolase YbcI (DUF457 family)